MTCLPTSSESETTGEIAELSRRLTGVLEPLVHEVTRRRSPDSFLGAGPAWPAGPDSPPMAVALCTLEGRFIEVNDALVALTGYARDEFVGRRGSELGVWGDVEDLLRCLRSKGSIDGYRLPYRTQAGETRSMLLAARLLIVKGRGGILAVGMDIGAASPSSETRL
jgi:PAS domain S-box-containing protein